MSQGFASDVPPAVNGTAKKYIRGMMKGKKRWSKLYGNRSKEVMHKTANKMAMGEMSKMPPTYNDLFGEANKSGDNSLRDWFGKSKSSDGTPGWVQLGGKFAGKPCAKQPGQTTKPKCGSSKMKRNLDKGEEDAAFRRKNAKDPNPNRKGKAKNVATEVKENKEELNTIAKELDGAVSMHSSQAKRLRKYVKKMKEKVVSERADMWHPDPEKDKKLGGPGANARAREDGAAASKPKEDPKKLKKGESYMDYSKRQKASKQKSGTATSRLNKLGANIKPKERKRDKIGRAIGNALDRVAGIKKEEAEMQEGMGDVAVAAIRKTQGDKPAYLSKRSEMIRRIKMKQLNSYMKKQDEKKAMKDDVEWVEGVYMTEEQFDEAAGEKDACYKKVKSRYSVWPSAYASGALSKCRKVGAANWGNSKKK